MVPITLSNALPSKSSRAIPVIAGVGGLSLGGLYAAGPARTSSTMWILLGLGGTTTSR